VSVTTRLDTSRAGTSESPASEVVVAVAHQKGGVGKSTSAALLATELAWLRPDAQILVEDLDPDRNLTSRWPGDTPTVHLIEAGQGEGHIRILDTGPGHTDRLAEVLRRADYVVVPVRMEPMSVQAVGLFLPRLREVQRAMNGCPRLAGFLATHYVTRSSEHSAMAQQLQTFAQQQGTYLLGVIPFLVSIGMRLSSKGHHYRPAAQQLLKVLNGAAS
jgi:cellulose biosynthesis protein BcsQ